MLAGAGVPPNGMVSTMEGRGHTLIHTYVRTYVRDVTYVTYVHIYVQTYIMPPARMLVCEAQAATICSHVTSA